MSNTTVTHRMTRTRPDIQALRALAVTAVVVYHLWPTRLPGGYVGVDVFFAVSGFLIVGQIAREVDRTGRLQLRTFWARRARRLLPAAFVVIITTGAAVLAFVPELLWRSWATQLGASAVYVQNWFLVGQGLDYSAADAAPSPAQHFWSLSVEEQFYIIIPVLLVVAMVAARRNKRVLMVTLTAVTVASFAYSIWLVQHDQPAAYFDTGSRAWEFSAGGLLALTAAAAGARVRAAVSWVGIAAVVFAVVAYSPTMPFPGTTALLPVVGTLAVIWAGTPDVAWAPSRIFTVRPVQRVGDLSYSIYLWHWPLLILAPYILHHTPGTPERVPILALTIGAAMLSKKYVEDRFRTGALVRRPAWVSLVGAAAVSSLLLAGCSAVAVHAQQTATTAAKATATAIAKAPDCVGAPAGLPDSGCDKPYAVTPLTNPAVAQTELAALTTYNGCQQVRQNAAVIRCVTGATAYTKTVAVVGDSHITQYLDALNAYGLKHGWRILAFTKSYCPGTGSAEAFNADPGTDAAATDCAEWGKAVLAQVAADETINGVLFSNFTERYVANNPHAGVGRPLAAQDFEAAWKPLLAAGKTVAAIRDNPNLGTTPAPVCVAQHLTDYDPCALPKSTALFAGRNPMLEAAAQMDVPALDFTDVFCDAATCHAVIGGLIVYYDSNHMNTTFSKTGADVFGPKIGEALGL